MEETLQISAIEPHKDESFSILCASLEASNRYHADESAEGAHLLSILSNIGCKYNDIGLAMATELDKLKAQHDAEIAKMQNNFEEMYSKLQKVMDERTNELESHVADKTALNQRHQLLKRFLYSIRDQIDEIFAHVNQSNQIVDAQQIDHDVVTIDGSESDDSASEMGNENEEMVQEQEQQPQAVETVANHVEGVDFDQEAHEVEPAQQDLSNGHDDTVVPSDDVDEKENVRPQSTPIGKAEAPAIAAKVTASTASTVSAISIAVPVLKSIATATIASAAAAAATTTPDPPLVEKAATENTIEPRSLGRKKKYNCIFCPKKFAKKANVFQHWETDHGRTMAKLPTLKRKHAKNDDDDYNDEEIIPSSNGHYVSAHNPLKNTVKRQKKNSAKPYRE